MGANNQKQQKIAISGETDNTVKDKHFNDKYIMTPIEIGRGANAVVMMATCKVNNRVVVVKKIKNDKSEKSRQLIKKECDISMSLKHPHILEFYDYFENEDETYLVCEYCQGGELYDLIRDTKIRTKRGITEDLARGYLAQIISAVEYLHCNMIAHRDLKPENILLDKDKKNVKICDFGMAAIVNSENYVNRRYSCCGSPGYFAPEIMKDFYQPLTSEVWSLGVVLYSMLAGEMPFGSGEEYMGKMRLEHTAYVTPAYFSADVKNLLAKMLVFNPKQRISLSKLKEHPWMMGSALPQKKYPALKLIEVWKLKYMVHLGYNAEEIYKAVIENKRDSMFVAMYHNLKPIHVPEALRPSFNMVNSEVPYEEDKKWKKMDKKSKSDPQYAYGDIRGDNRGDNKGDIKSERKSDIKSDIKSERKSETLRDNNSDLKTENQKSPMKSSLANFSLAKPTEIKDRPVANFSKKNHSFLDELVNNFTEEGPVYPSKRSSSDNTEPFCDDSRRSSIIRAEASFDAVNTDDTINNQNEMTQLDESLGCSPTVDVEIGKPIRTSKTPLPLSIPFVNIINKGTSSPKSKKSSSPLMQSPRISPVNSPMQSPPRSLQQSHSKSHPSSPKTGFLLQERSSSPLYSPQYSLLNSPNSLPEYSHRVDLKPTISTSAPKSVNNSPNRFHRFESITRRASDIFRSKKKQTEDSSEKLSTSVDSATVSSLLISPIDRLSQRDHQDKND